VIAFLEASEPAVRLLRLIERRPHLVLS
jgi:hypothetical protein